MQCGQGDKIFGEVQLPEAIRREKAVVCYGALGLQFGTRGTSPNQFGGKLLLTDSVAGEIMPHGLLKFGWLFGINGEDGGKAELTDDLHQRAPSILIPLIV